MTISYSSISSSTQAGSTSVLFRQPNTLASGDLVLWCVVNKYPTNAPGTPTGFTLLGREVMGDSAAAGADVGDVYGSVYYRVSDGTEDAATETISIPSGNSATSRSVSYARTGGSGWDIAYAWGEQGAGASSWTITTNSLDLATGDMVVVFIPKNSDNDLAHSAHALSASGVTFGAFTSRNSPVGTTQGDDVAYQIGEFPVTAGSGTGPVTFTMTLSGSAGVSSGGVMLVRLREAGGGTDLTLADAAHAHTADSLTLTADSSLTVADAAHAHAADNVALSATGSASLTVADAAHAHTSEEATLTLPSGGGTKNEDFSGDLSEYTQLHTVAAVISGGQLAGTSTAETGIFHSAGTYGPDQRTTLRVADGPMDNAYYYYSAGVRYTFTSAEHFTCYRGSIGGSGDCYISRVNDGSASYSDLQSGSIGRPLVLGDEIELSAVGTALVLKLNGATILSTTDGTYTSGRPGVELYHASHLDDAVFEDLSAGGAASLTVADAAHVHTSDAPSLTTDSSLNVADAAHVHTSDAPSLTADLSLNVADAAHAHTSDAPSLTADSSLTVADAAHAHTSDNAALGATGSASLTVADAAHVHTSDAPSLTTDSSLNVADAAHVHTSDAPSLTADSSLNVADAAHAHTSVTTVLTLPGGETWPDPATVLAGVTYGPTGTEYVGTMDLVAAVVAALQSTLLPVNVKQMNDAEVIGDGSEADQWRGVGVP